MLEEEEASAKKIVEQDDHSRGPIVGEEQQQEYSTTEIDSAFVISSSPCDMCVLCLLTVRISQWRH